MLHPAKHIIGIVDDDGLISGTLKNRFESGGMMVYTASDSEGAKEILKKYKPEILLLDLLLTKDEGSQGILDYIKSVPELSSMPVLVLTNLDKPELKNMLLSQGVREYIVKGSLSLDDLYEKVLGYLEPV